MYLNLKLVLMKVRREISVENNVAPTTRCFVPRCYSVFELE